MKTVFGYYVNSQGKVTYLGWFSGVKPIVYVRIIDKILLIKKIKK